MRCTDENPPTQAGDDPAAVSTHAKEVAAQMIAAAKATTRAYRQVRAKRGRRRRQAQLPALEPRRPGSAGT